MTKGLTGGEGRRHQRIGGFTDDREQYEAALNACWIVYRVPAWIYKGSRRIWRSKMLFTIRRFGGLPYGAAMPSFRRAARAA